MAGHQPHHAFPSELNVRDPEFSRRAALWAAQAQSEMAKLVEATKKQIAISHDLLSAVDRMLACSFVR